MSTDALQLADLSRTFGSTTVLSGIDLSLDQGERLAVVGSSGSGKTTLLRLIAGLDVPTTGSIVIGGRIVSRAGKLIVPPEHRGVAMVFQGLALFPHLRALDQVAFAAKGEEGLSRARELLERVGLGHRSSAALDELSGGERQRIALARAFAQRPQLLLMDESFASLDDERRAEMRRLLRSLLDEVGTTLILVTHSRNDALDLATRVLVLDRGQPIAAGPLSNVLAEPDHAAAVRSLGLGQILEGHSIGNASADTAFGPVALSHPAAIGRIRLLVRAAQPQISEEGVEAEIIAIELRPPETGSRVRRFGIARAETATLRIELGDHPASIGARIKIRIDGVCRTLDS